MRVARPQKRRDLILCKPLHQIQHRNDIIIGMRGKAFALEQSREV